MSFSNVGTFTVDGITFRGAGLGAGNDMPVKGVVIKDCRFENIAASNHFPTNRAIYSSKGPSDSRIESNNFENVGLGIELFSVARLAIVNNAADTLTAGDWLHITNSEAGDDVTISGNRLSNLYSMGIELQGVHWQRLDVADNQLLSWAVKHSTLDSWGISLAIGHAEIARSTG